MSTHRFRLIFSLTLVGALLLAGSTHAASRRFYVPQGKTLVAMTADELLKRKPDSEWTRGIQIQNLGESESASAHLVWIKTEEKPHVHAKHDATVIMLKGHGSLLYGAQRIPLKEGDVISMTRGTVHAFRNESKQPAAVYVVFSPPFDGKDVIEVHDVVQ